MSSMPDHAEQAFPDSQPAACPWASLLLFLAAFSALFCYLHRPVQFSGDGAAYVLQALDGSPWERSIHVGLLAPLWVWVR
ncbi:MAG: hypothetical protein VX498_04920, partial [Myxococcota bacterium]|nr:hypothetical protein [Myxococcota bacterium]